MNYDDSPILLGNYRTANPRNWLRVIDGQVYSGTDGFIARCTDDAHAKAILIEAGYTESPKEPGFYSPDAKRSGF